MEDRVLRAHTVHETHLQYVRRESKDGLSIDDRLAVIVLMQIT